MKFRTIGDKNKPVVIWAHGWGQSHEAFTPLATSLEKFGRHILLDLPGFGDTPVPEEIWGTAQYADFVAEFIKSKTDGKIIWVGHSFGCRVGLQLAARYSELVSGMLLISAAGLSRKMPPHKRLYFKLRIMLFKTLKKIIPPGHVRDKLIKSFGSADYQSAGPMRSIFVKVVNEDLSEQAKTISCPVKLVYGTDDKETPPDIGERLNKLISDSEMVHLEGHDHYSVLSGGRHQIAGLLKRFLEEI